MQRPYAHFMRAAMYSERGESDKAASHLRKGARYAQTRFGTGTKRAREPASPFSTDMDPGTARRFLGASTTATPGDERYFRAMYPVALRIAEAATDDRAQKIWNVESAYATLSLLEDPLAWAYDVLGAARGNASDATKKYRALALKYHPDKNPNAPPEIAAKFLLIQKARDAINAAQMFGRRRARLWQ